MIKMVEKEPSKDEQIGFHKGAMSTLIKERQEMTKIIGIVDSLIKMHYDALKKLGVDLGKIEKDAKDIKGLEENL